MGRVIAVTILVALVVLAAIPPVVGMFLESNIRAELQIPEPNPYIEYRLTDYDRGLYSSDGVMAVRLTEEYANSIRAQMAGAAMDDPDFRSDLEEFLQGEMQVDFDVHHGPFLVRRPGLGIAGFNSELMPPDGELAKFVADNDLPYLLRARGTFDFGDTLTFHYDIPPVSNENEELAYSFTGFDAHGVLDLQSMRLKAEGGSERLRMLGDDGEVTAEGLAFSVDQTLRNQTLWLGEFSMTLDGITVNVPLPQSVEITVSKLNASGHVNLDPSGEKLQAKVRYALGSLSGMPESEIDNFEVTIEISDVDADAYARYIELYQDMAINLDDPEQAARINTEMAPMLADIIKGSPRLRLSPVKFNYNGEPFTLDLDVSMDGSDIPDDIDPAMLVNPMMLVGLINASGYLETSQVIATQIAQSVMKGQIAGSLPPDEQISPAQIEAIAAQQAAGMIDMLMQQGLLRIEGNSLRADAEFSAGELKVNGTAIPLGPM